MKKDQILKLERIEFAYNQSAVIKGLSLSLFAGERLGIVGGSGSGKSTLLRILAGELKAQGGRITLYGQDFEEERNDRVPSHPKLSLMAQDFELSPSLTCDENISKAARHLSPTAVKKYLARVHRAFQLGKVKKQKTSTLSGGQKQRVALAASLISPGKILLLDEPFSQVDYQLKQDLLAFLEEEQIDKAIIIVGHEPTDLLRFCDRIAVLDKGRVRQIASVHAIYHHPKDSKVARLTGLINILDREQQQICGLYTAMFRPVHCRLEVGGDWVLKQQEYHAFGQLALLEHAIGGFRIRAQVPIDQELNIGSFWKLSIKKP
jgi:ABC-type Fe3+/spermidine/putrescine transport system ATPase subunit